MKILDCTLRDGGYYTNWQFSDNLVKDLIKSLIDSEVDIIELGYKSDVPGGRFRKCDDNQLVKILPMLENKYAFMIDMKDFIKNNELDFNLINKVIKEKKFFSFCRLAIKSDQISCVPAMYEILKQRGYKIIINLMKATDITIEELSPICSILKDLDLEAVYFADSYGNLYPQQISGIVKALKVTQKDIGFHSHDNLGLAFANSLECLNQGVSYIDGTVTGMGRGVGNLKLEQLLLQQKKLSDSLLLTIQKHFYPMQSNYKWGFSIPYMFAGINGIHPLKAQKINSSELCLIEKMQSLKNLD